MKSATLWFVLLACVFPAFAQKNPILFQDVRVFDGVKVIATANVLIRDGRILAVGPEVTDPAAQIVDGHGKTLLPGLIDAHVHVWGQEALEQALVFGVTTELDMFMPVRLMARIKGLNNKNAADFWSSGTLATAPGGHGTEYGFPIPTINSPKDAQAWVDARLREGSDYVKIVYAEGFGRFPSINQATLAALVAAAHKRGRLAIVHINTLQQARTAIEAGADGLAHLFRGPVCDDDFGRLAAAHHVFVIPTLTILHNGCDLSPPGPRLLSDPRLEPFLTRDAIAGLRRMAPWNERKVSCNGAREAIEQLKAAGVPILAGTDVPNPGTTQGASLHQELQMLVEAGLTPTEALVAATSAPAAAFHISDRGRIAPGLRADLLLVKGNPAEDILATRDIVAVYKQGIALDREKLLARIAKEKKH